MTRWRIAEPYETYIKLSHLGVIECRHGTLSSYDSSKQRKEGSIGHLLILLGMIIPDVVGSFLGN